MNVVIIDDEIYCCEVLQLLLQKHCKQVTNIKIFSNSSEGLAFIRHNPPDILFLDIEMPILNGFDLLKELGEINFNVIFTTAYDKYAVRAFRFNALDYLLKPIDKEELIKAVKKITEKKPEEKKQGNEILKMKSAFQKNPDVIAISSMEGITFIEVKDIVYCESDGSYTAFFFNDNRRIQTSKPIKDVEETLTDSGFYRVHQSYLINMRHIRKYIRGDGGEVVMSNGKTINVSRQKKQEFLSFFSKI
jgi:two-component system LytT family response regulator